MRRSCIFVMAAAIVFVSASLSSAATRSYEVRPGDTLWNIATHELGDGKRWTQIAAVNGLVEPFRIVSGQKLILPDSAAASANSRVEFAVTDSYPITVTVSGDSNLAEFAIIDLKHPAIIDTGFGPVRTFDTTPRVIIYSNGSKATFSADTSAIASLPPLPPAVVIARPAVTSSDAVTGPLTLEDAVGIGMTHAPEIAGAVATVRRSRADEGVARSGAFPQVIATGDARRSETFRSTSLLGVDEFTAGGTLSITQALLSFGRLSNALKAASAQEAAALASLSAAKSRVRFRVESAFLSLLLDKTREQVAHDAVLAAAALERRARIRDSVGVGTRFDISRALAERAARQARLAAASSAIETAREELAVSMGLPPGTYLTAEGDLFATPRPIAPAEAIRIGMAERPDLAALEYSVKSGVALIDYERAQDNPSVGATASYTYTRHDYITRSAFFKGQDASSGFIGLGVTVPLFDGFRVRERVRSQTASVDELKSRQARAKLDAERDIRGVYFDLAASQEALAARRAGVSAAADALHMAQVSFEAGRSSALDVIQASAALAEARGTEAEAAFSYRIGLARLIAVTGTDAVMEK